MLLNMAVKIALAVGLFIVICVPPGLKSSQVVPDGLVYTEVKKTLVRGVQAVLTCRFYGKPIAVYWRKGLDPDDLNLMVIWHDDEVSGPRYDDGSCDIDENYSLIINNVSTADAGRIYCTVSNNKGPLMKNYTDILVLDTAITTNLQATLQLRQATYGILQCTVHIKARRVSWKKGTTSSANGSLVVIENNQEVADRSGAGYDDGTYNITQDYSLVIKQVQVHREGLYICEVTDYTGTSFRKNTFVNVVAQPLEPFPTIQECLNAGQYDSNNCILVAKSGTTLTCQAVKYYPSINLSFLYGSSVLEPSDTREWTNADGTKNKTITIATGGNKELYTCVAFNTPGTKANISTSVLIHGDEPVKSTLVKILVYSICLVCAALILIASVAYFIWRKNHHIGYSAVSRPNVRPGPEVGYSAVSRPNVRPGPEDIVVIKHRAQEDFKKLEQHLNEVVITHYKTIYHFIEPDSAIQAEKLIKENRAALFKTHQMMIDWLQSQTSTRNKEPIDKENESAVSWPSNEELKSISRHITQESLKKLCKNSKIDFQCDDANDEEKRFETLRKWRTKAPYRPVKETWKQLFSVLESHSLGGLLPTLRGPYIYKAELVDFAFNLLIHDLYPVARMMGINATKLISYRPTFSPSHLEIGTIKLLIALKENYNDLICSETVNLNYRTVAITRILEYDMSYGELCSISEAINQNAQGYADEATSVMLPGPGMNIPEELRILLVVLQLTYQDIADCRDTPGPLTAYEIFKIWKEMPRPSVFNYRAALAHGIQINGMPGLADDILAGTYITEQTSLAIIEKMVQGLDEHQIKSLDELLHLNGGRENRQTSTPSKEISKQIYYWVADWTTGIKSSWFSDALGKPRAEKHRDLNDKLVEHGFLDLAREIMIIEQQQLDRKTVVEYVKDKIFLK